MEAFLIHLDTPPFSKGFSIQILCKLLSLHITGSDNCRLLICGHTSPNMAIFHPTHRFIKECIAIRAYALNMYDTFHFEDTVVSPYLHYSIVDGV